MDDGQGDIVKVKNIFLTKDPSETSYRVEKVTDSIAYTPGTYVDAEVVQELCDAEDWKVTITKTK